MMTRRMRREIMTFMATAVTFGVIVFLSVTLTGALEKAGIPAWAQLTIASLVASVIAASGEFPNARAVLIRKSLVLVAKLLYTPREVLVPAGTAMAIALIVVGFALNDEGARAVALAAGFAVGVPSIAFFLGDIQRATRRFVYALAKDPLLLSIFPRRQRAIFDFNPKRHIVLVYPPYGEDTAGALLPQVAGEDFMAMQHIERSLTADYDISRIGARAANLITKDDRPANLVIISSPQRNPLAGEFLREINAAYMVRVAFVESAEHKGRQEIDLADTRFTSPAYDQEEDLRAHGKAVALGRLEDYALLVRAGNPWNPDTKVLLVAGIRGIGTWGAALHASMHTDELFHLVAGEDFAAIVRVTYENHNITQTQILGATALAKVRRSQSARRPGRTG